MGQIKLMMMMMKRVRNANTHFYTKHINHRLVWDPNINITYTSSLVVVTAPFDPKIVDSNLFVHKLFFLFKKFMCIMPDLLNGEGNCRK